MRCREGQDSGGNFPPPQIAAAPTGLAVQLKGPFRSVAAACLIDAVLGNVVEQALWADDEGLDIALGHSGPRLKSGSPARAKTTWYDTGVLDPPVDQQHGDYIPAPSDLSDGLPNGWSAKRERVGSLLQSVLRDRPGLWPPTAPIPEP